MAAMKVDDKAENQNDREMKYPRLNKRPRAREPLTGKYHSNQFLSYAEAF